MTELNERVSSVETTVKFQGKEIEKHDKRIEKVEDNTAILGRMSLLLEQQTEMNKEQHITLSKINENLDNLNVSQVELQTEMKTMNSRIQKVEKTQEEEKEKNSLDLSGLPKKAILWAVSVFLGGISLYLYIKFGLR